MDLVVKVYQITKGFPREETYGLTNQLRRAAVSIPSNIAEGQGRHTAKEFQRFLAVAYGSLQETETQLMLSRRLGYIDEARETEILAHCSEVARLINGLANSLGPTDH
jgi:four helix bundle protein